MTKKKKAPETPAQEPQETQAKEKKPRKTKLFTWELHYKAVRSPRVKQIRRKRPQKVKTKFDTSLRVSIGSKTLENALVKCQVDKISLSMFVREAIRYYVEDNLNILGFTQNLKNRKKSWDGAQNSNARFFSDYAKSEVLMETLGLFNEEETQQIYDLIEFDDESDLFGDTEKGR